MQNKNESKASRREPQPSTVSNGRARKDTCRKSQLFFWTSNHEKKMQEIQRNNAGQWMQIATCVVIIVGTAVNAAVNIPANGPGHEGGMESTKQRRNLVHTRHMGINKDVWQLPQVKEEEDHKGYRMFDSNSHFEQQYPLPHKLTMDLKQMKWNQEPIEAIPDSGRCMQTREETVDKWLAKTIRTIITVAQGEWLVEMSKGLQLVLADTKTGQLEHYAIVVTWESSSMEVRLDEKIPSHVNSYSAVSSTLSNVDV